MSFQDKANDFAMGVGVYYAMLIVVISYPAFTIAFFVGLVFGVSAGAIIWLLGMAVLGTMMHRGLIKPLIWIAVLTICPFFLTLKMIF